MEFILLIYSQGKEDNNNFCLLNNILFKNCFLELTLNYSSYFKSITKDKVNNLSLSLFYI